MKRRILFMAIVAAIGFTSCTEESDLPSDNSSISDITSNRGDIVGTNQTVELSCPVYVLPEATSVTIDWVNSLGITVDADSYENGVSKKAFAITSAKDATITCKASYLYGAEWRYLSKSINFTVVNSHFVKSFIGDSFETVSSDSPVLTLMEENVYYGGTDSDETSYYYTFSDGNLLNGKTIRACVESSATHSLRISYNYFGTYVSAYEREVGVSGSTVYSVSYGTGYTPTAAELAIIEDFEEDGTLAETDDRDILGGLVDQRSISLTATVTMDTTPANGIVTKCEIYHSASAAEGTYMYTTTTQAI